MDHETDEPLESGGGQGGPLSLFQGAGQTSDTRLVERAIREQWPIPDKYRAPLIRRQIRIALHRKASPREATLAFKAVLAANAQNMEQAARDNPQAQHVVHSGTIDLSSVRREVLEQCDVFGPQYQAEIDVPSQPVTNGEANGHGNGQPG